MTTKAEKIIGWTAAILLAAFNLFAVFGKFVAPEPGSAGDVFAIEVGMRGLEIPLGILELVVVILFLIPRTMTVGFVLMVGYMAGVIASMLTHGFTVMESWPMYLTLVILAVCGWFRHPELRTRLLGKPVVA